MKRSVSNSGRAEADLTNQYRWFLDNTGIEVAGRFLISFDATISKLSRTPFLGRMRRFCAPEQAGIRSVPVAAAFSSHFFYQVASDVLSIERVMHGARNLEPRLIEQPGS